MNTNHVFPVISLSKSISHTAVLHYLLWWWWRLHVALWWGWGLHDLLGWWRWWRWRMGVTGSRLVARWRRQWLTRSRHDIARLRWVLGNHRWSLIHGGWLRVLTGALPTEGHLAKLGCKFFSLVRMSSQLYLRATLLETGLKEYDFQRVVLIKTGTTSHNTWKKL